MPRERVTDLTPREEELAALLKEPLTVAEIQARMRLSSPDVARMWVSQLGRKRPLRVRFRYGGTTYQLAEQVVSP